MLGNFPSHRAVCMFFTSDVSLGGWMHREVGEGSKLNHPKQGVHHGDDKDLQEEDPEGLKTESEGLYQWDRFDCSR